MNEWDYYYKAFKNFRSITKDNDYLKISRNSLINNEPDNTSITSTKLKVNINEDWILEIESKMMYLEKAVKEERQFISRDGEIIPIEKVKRVSRESVKHLAKNSNLISKDSLEGDIIPEKLYMEEKTNDYKVYENRFLYYVLYFLDEFISIRLDAINKALLTYKGELKLYKNLKLKNNIIKFDLNFKEENYENSYYNLTEDEKVLIERIEAIKFSVSMLLDTELMKQVSKAPLIKLPIVKTNPIKMNTNFKKALELFEFVNSYDSDGYEIVEEINTICPLSDNISDEFQEIIKLTSFLTFEYGTDITNRLKAEYEKSKELELQKEKEALALKIKNLKHRIETENLSPFEYMVLLEKYNRQLENDTKDLLIYKNKVIELEELNYLLNNNIKNLNELIIKKDKEIEAWAIKYETDINNLHLEYENKINKLEIDYTNNINMLKENYDLELINLENKYNEDIKLLDNEYNTKLDNIKDDYDNKLIEAINDEKEAIKNEVISYKEKIESLNYELGEVLVNKEEIINDYTSKLEDINSKYDLLLNSKKELDSMYLALRYKNNDVNIKNYSSYEKFKELEELKSSLDKLYKESWVEAKKVIRKESLWAKIKDALKKKK